MSTVSAIDTTDIGLVKTGKLLWQNKKLKKLSKV